MRLRTYLKKQFVIIPMQKGDPKATWSDSSLLKNLTNYSQKLILGMVS